MKKVRAGSSFRDIKAKNTTSRNRQLHQARNKRHFPPGEPEIQNALVGDNHQSAITVSVSVSTDIQSRTSISTQTEPQSTRTTSMQTVYVNDDQLKEELKRLRAENQRLTTTVQRWTNETIGQAAQYFQNRLRQKELENRSLTDQVNVLKRKLDSCRKGLGEMKKNLANETNTDLMVAINAKTTALEEAAQLRIDNEEKAKTIKELNQRLDRLLKGNASMRTRRNALMKKYVTLRRDLANYVKIKQLTSSRILIQKFGSISQKVFTYVPSGRKPTTQISARNATTRGESMQPLLVTISGSSNAVDIGKTVVEYLKQHDDVASIVQRSGVVAQPPKRLTAIETQQLKTRVKLSSNQIDSMRSFLKEKNLDILASMWTIRKATKLPASKTQLVRSEVVVENGKEITAFID